MLTKRPFPVIKTYLGHVSYSPKLLSEEIKDPYICQIELSEIIRRDFQEINIKDLFKMPENQINILSLRHMDYGLVIVYYKYINISFNLLTFPIMTFWNLFIKATDYW